MKKFYILPILILAAALCLPACISTTPAPDCRSADVFCVGLVTDGGKIDDQSVNQFTWEGIQQAKKELGVYTQYIETTDWKDYDKNIATFGDDGYDLVVTIGSDMGDATTRAAAIYPTTRFIGIDQPQDTTKAVPANLVGLAFPEDQAGFLAGALAAQMSKSKKIGAVCGTDIIPNIWRYCEGYKAGAVYIDPSIKVTVAYHNNTDMKQAVADPEWGAANASALIGNGADVIFGVGGSTGSGAITAAALRNVYAIGAESDQYDVVIDARKMLLSSAIKFISPAVFDLIRLTREDKFPTGNYFGNIGYAPFHNLIGEVPSKVKIKMREIARGLAEGSIVTNVSSAKP